MLFQCQSKRKLRVGHVAMFKFDLEVKDKSHSGVIIVRITSSHSDTTMYKTWYANVKSKKVTG